MVFSSISAAHLDPSNWQQQQQQQHPSRQPAGSSGPNPHPHRHQLQPPPPPPPPQQQQLSHGPVGGGTMIRPRSIAECARLANIPMPEAALKCPRCESTNTKFCYFNNYNLSQLRHFCKTCRRYWTMGGKLRNIPVGGGCRRNKRAKSSSSNKKDKRSTTSASSSSVSDNSASSNMLASCAGCATSSTAELPGLMSQIQSLGFIAPMHHCPNHHLTHFASSKIGLTYGGISTQPLEGITGDLNFQLSGGIDGGNSGGTGGIEQWHVQQFPYISNHDLQAGLNPTYERGAEPSIITTKPITSGLTSQPTSAKIENNNNTNNNQADWNLSRRMAWIQGNGQFWGPSGSMWADHPGFSPGNNNAR